MAQAISTTPPVSDVVEGVAEKSERRRSFFEKPGVDTLEKAEVEDEWDLRFGKYNLPDYVNVVRYPVAYVQKIRDEKEMWMKGLDHMQERAKRLEAEEDEESNFVVTEDILTTKQKANLKDIDSKIDEFMQETTKFLGKFEAHKRRQKIKLMKIERETKLIEKLATEKK